MRVWCRRSMMSKKKEMRDIYVPQKSRTHFQNCKKKNHQTFIVVSHQRERERETTKKHHTSFYCYTSKKLQIATHTYTMQSWTSGGTEHILPLERSKASFDVDKMTYILDGGEKETRKRRWIQNAHDDVLEEKTTNVV